MKDGHPITETDEQELLDFVRDSYRNKVAETVELYIRIKYPLLKKVEVTCNGSELLINYLGDVPCKEELTASVNQFITDART